MDRVTKAIAEGYTLGSDAKASGKFTGAAEGLQSYMDQARQLQRRGQMAPETTSLLVDQATRLQQLVRAQAASHY